MKSSTERLEYRSMRLIGAPILAAIIVFALYSASGDSGNLVRRLFVSVGTGAGVWLFWWRALRSGSSGK